MCKVKSHRLCALRASKDCKWNTLSITDDLLIPADEVVSTSHALSKSLLYISLQSGHTEERKLLPIFRQHKWVLPQAHDPTNIELKPPTSTCHWSLALEWGGQDQEKLSWDYLMSSMTLPLLISLISTCLFLPFRKLCPING